MLPIKQLELQSIQYLLIIVFNEISILHYLLIIKVLCVSFQVTIFKQVAHLTALSSLAFNFSSSNLATVYLLQRLTPFAIFQISLVNTLCDVKQPFGNRKYNKLILIFPIYLHHLKRNLGTEKNFLLYKIRYVKTFIFVLVCEQVLKTHVSPPLRFQTFGSLIVSLPSRYRCLTLCALTQVIIFSILFSVHLLRC